VSEVHRLGAPAVTAASCESVILELPPLPPDHCDTDERQRIAIEMKAPAGDWAEVRHNVLMSKSLVDHLQPDLAFEFRMVLRRPSAGDRIGESTGLVVTEDAAASSISAPPEVFGEWHEGQSTYSISWAQASGTCRGGEHDEWALEVAAAGSESLVWAVLLDRVVGSSVRVIGEDCGACVHAKEGCVFRVRPLTVAGWSHPGEPSAPQHPGQTPRLFSGRLVAMLLVAVLLGPPAYLAWNQYQRRGSFDKEELLEDARDLTHQLLITGREGAIYIVREAPGAVRSCAKHSRENASWLYGAWLKGLGMTGVYERPLGNDSDDDDDDSGCLDDIAMDDYTVRRRIPGPALPSVREEDEVEEDQPKECQLGASGSSSATSEGVVVEVPVEQDDDEFTRL